MADQQTNPPADPPATDPDGIVDRMRRTGVRFLPVGTLGVCDLETGEFWSAADCRRAAAADRLHRQRLAFDVTPARSPFVGPTAAELEARVHELFAELSTDPNLEAEPVCPPADPPDDNPEV